MFFLKKKLITNTFCIFPVMINHISIKFKFNLVFLLFFILIALSMAQPGERGIALLRTLK